MKNVALLAAAVAALGGSSAFDVAQAANPNANPYTIAVPPLSRMNYKYRQKGSCPAHRFRSQQYANSCFRVDLKGNLTIKTKFSYSKSSHKNAFFAHYEFLDAAKKRVDSGSVCHEFSSEPVFMMNRSREQVKDKEWSISTQDAARIAFVRITWEDSYDCGGVK